jgi:integrase/recombinase XerD
MSAVKIVLRTKKNKDGSSPLAIRITKDRKSSFLYLGINLFEKEWDQKSQTVRKAHPNSARMNNLIAAKKAEALNSSLELETEKTQVTSVAVKKKIKQSAGLLFLQQADLYISALRAEGKFNRVSAEQPRINRFREFMKGSDIKFSDISVRILENYKSWLLSTRRITERTAINHLSVIRSVFSFAKKEDPTIAKYYPFGSGKIVIEFPESKKSGLADKDVAMIEGLDLTNDPGANHARNIWLFAFYFAGMRISDVLRLRHSDFQNGRLTYTMGKNDKNQSLKVPERAQRILEQYREPNGKLDLVFPDLASLESFEDKYEVQRRINVVASKINKHLKKITKALGINVKITNHTARHTFGNISGDRINVQMLQKLYRHSSITTTIGYQANFIHKDADEALDAVLG